MTDTGVSGLERSLQETQQWLSAIASELGSDRQGAYQALRAVLAATRDNLNVGEAAHLGAQLPLVVRGIYYEGFAPAKMPARDRSRDAFLDRVRALLAADVDAEEAARAVFALLQSQLSAGQATQVKEMLHAEVQALWPAEGGRRPDKRSGGVECCLMRG